MPILLTPTPTAPASRRNDRWSFTLYPDAAEGGGCFRPSRREPPAYVPRGLASDPARSALEAARRARSKLRRYAAANRLNRLGTLTYAGEGCHDPLALRADLAAFFRSLRMELGGEPLPYVWVPEWHKTGHGLHAHFAVNRFIKRSVIEHAWGRGFVHIKMLGGLKVGSGPLAEARSAAGYLSKYVSKTFDEPDFGAALGLHRYDVAQGFQPVAIHLSGASSDGVLDQASDYLGSLPKRSWSSAQVQNWDAAPAIWAQWGA